MSSAADLPLTGIRVIDLTRVLAGPYCTMILADLGAEVVKIERPGVGDDARHFGPFLPTGLSAYFASINRGKKSIVLDLKTPADRDTFLELVAKSDVLVENFRPGTMEAFGLGMDRLREVRPDLIYAAATGFGQRGRYGQRPAYDVIVQAMSGLMSITGHSPEEPARVGTSISDILPGIFTALGILAALRTRDRSGRGSSLDLAMLDCTVATLENALSRYEVAGQVPGPLGTRHPSITPFQAFHARDRAIVIAAGNDVLWKRLCEVLGTSELIEDPRFLTNGLRTENHEALEPLLEARFALRSADEWLAELSAAGVPCAPIRDMADVAGDEHLAERGMLHTMEDAGGGTFLTAGSPLNFDGTPVPLSSHAPALGEHTELVLRDWLDRESPQSGPSCGS